MIRPPMVELSVPCDALVSVKTLILLLPRQQSSPPAPRDRLILRETAPAVARPCKGDDKNRAGRRGDVSVGGACWPGGGGAGREWGARRKGWIWDGMCPPPSTSSYFSVNRWIRLAPPPA